MKRLIEDTELIELVLLDLLLVLIASVSAYIFVTSPVSFLIGLMLYLVLHSVYMVNKKPNNL